MIVLIVLLILGRMAINMVGHEVASGLSDTIGSHDQTIISAVERVAAPQSANVTVTNVLGWLPCPLTNDAMGMIGYNPPGSPSLDAGRAKAVNDQAVRLLATSKPAEFRLTQPDPTHLVVFVGAPTIGVPLIDCSAQTASSALNSSSSPTTTAG